MKLLMHVATQVFALLVVSYLIPGFIIVDVRAAVVAAIVIGLINMFIRPILQLIALPITLFTLGLFAFFINVALLLLAAEIVPGFDINGFLTAAIASVVLALINAFFNQTLKER